MNYIYYLLNSNQALMQKQAQTHSQPYRYVNLSLFVLAALVNAFPGQLFSSIAPHTKQLYDVSELQVNINSMMTAFAVIFFNFPVNYILDKWGLKIGTLVGQYLICMGLLVRLFLNYSFSIFLAGSALCSLGGIFIINSPNKFSIKWFPIEKVPLINSLAMFAIFTSTPLGNVFPAIFLTESSTKSDYFRFLLIQTCVIFGIQILMAILFRGEPKYSQNYVANLKREDPINAIKSLVSNKDYMLIFSSITSIYGCLSIFFITLAWPLKLYGFNSVTNGILIMIASGFGLLGCGILGNLLKRTRKYKMYSTFCAFGSTLSMIIVFGGAQLGIIQILYAGGALFGLFCFPFLTTMTNFSAQVAFPVGEAMSAGNLFIGGQFIGIVGGITLGMIFDGVTLWKNRLGIFILVLLMLIGSIIIFWIEQNLKRSKADEQIKQRVSKNQSLLSNEQTKQ